MKKFAEIVTREEECDETEKSTTYSLKQKLDAFVMYGEAR